MSENPEEKLNNAANGAEQDAEQDKTSSEVAALEKDLAELKKKADEYLASWQRTQADFANYRRRTEQEKLDLGKFLSQADLTQNIKLEPGDVVYVPETSKPDWSKVSQVISSVFNTSYLFRMLGL